jgi:hypothetical protein
VNSFSLCTAYSSGTSWIIALVNAFVSLMNGYAKKMGLTNTTFMTVHGLDAPGQFSTRHVVRNGNAGVVTGLNDDPFVQIFHGNLHAGLERRRS